VVRRENWSMRRIKRSLFNRRILLLWREAPGEKMH